MATELHAGWTVMVFMADRNNLEPFAAVDLSEMARVGSTQKLKVLVQIGTMCGRPPQRFVVRKDKCEACAPAQRMLAGGLSQEATNTGNPDVLRDFLAFALKDHPAAHYLLILWGHFIGIGFGKVGRDSLTLPELATTLNWFRDQREGRPLEILGGDTCSMSFAEAGYQLRDVVDLMVTSEVPTQFAGWPYQSVLRAIEDHPGTIEPPALGRAIVNVYIDSYKPPSVSLTMLDLKHADDVRSALADVVRELNRFGATGDGNATSILQAFLQAGHSKVRALIDLLDLCHRIKTDCDDERLRAAASAAIKALNQGAKKFVAFYRSNQGKDISELHGLGIYAPLVTTAEDWYAQQITEDVYKGLDLPSRTDWGNLVYGLAKVTQNPKPGIAKPA